MTERTPGFATLAIHAGAQPDPTTGARATPIYQTTSFVFDDVDHAASLFGLQAFGNIYTRIGNPTNAVLEERVAALEGGTAGLAVASGHAAQVLVFHCLMKPGDEFVASRKLYGGSINQFNHSYKSFGWNVIWADSDDLDAFAAAVTPKLPYDWLKDLAPVSITTRFAPVMVVSPTLPVKDLKEFIALLKANPGKYSFASSGTGTAVHLAEELFRQKAGVDIVHVPYRGAIFTDVIGGRVTMTMQNVGAILPTVQQKQLRAVAVTSLKRSSVLPELPTIDESGLRGFEAISWFGLMAPAGTPVAIVDKVYKQAAQMVAAPEMKAKLAQLGLDTTSDPPDAFGAIIKSDIAKWAKVIQEANIKAEQ
mgnify:CR=1 FL=1